MGGREGGRVGVSVKESARRGGGCGGVREPGRARRNGKFHTRQASHPVLFPSREVPGVK